MEPPLDQTESYLRLLAEHERWLATYVHSLVAHVADAEDILQEVKLTLWREFSKFQQGTHFRAWARAIALHRVLNYRRKQKRLAHADVDEDFIQAIAAEIEQRSDQLEARADALRLCLQKLPKEHHRVILWRYQEERSIEEISQLSQRTVEAVYRLLSRIRAVLNECITRQIHHASL